MATLSTFRGGGSSLSAGSIVQMQTSTYENFSAHVSTASATSTSTGASITITPTSASNKILLEFTSNMMYGRNSTPMLWQLYRSISGGSAGYLINYNQSYPYYYGLLYRSGDDWGPDNPLVLDTSHNTTNEITYTLYHRMTSNGSTSYTMHQGQSMVFKAIEIQV